MRISPSTQRSPDLNICPAADVSPADVRGEDAISAEGCDPLRRIAEQVADCFAKSGYAFVEDDKIEGLAALLGSFLAVAGIPANPPGLADPGPGGRSSTARTVSP